MDCGSGIGRTVLQAAREYGVQRAIGIGLSEQHRIAQAAGRRADHLRSRSAFLCADPLTPSCGRLEAAERWSGACGRDSRFTCSVMFDEELMRRLARCIAACPTVRLVATLKRFPDDVLAGFREAPPPECCETSWTAPRSVDNPQGAFQPGSSVYIYLREQGRERGRTSSRACRQHLSSRALVGESDGDSSTSDDDEEEARGEDVHEDVHVGNSRVPTLVPAAHVDTEKTTGVYGLLRLSRRVASSRDGPSSKSEWVFAYTATPM